MQLTSIQLDTFNDNGVLVVNDFLNSEETKTLLQRSKELLSKVDLEKHPKTEFKTGDHNHVGDEYFFDSSDKISYFFDVDAFDDEGNLRYPVEQSINKIGHGLHMKDKEFEKITLSSKVQAIAKSLGFEDPRVLQSMCIFKQPKGQTDVDRKNAVPPHTDGTFLYTEPQSAVGFWIALEDCDETNGCLYYDPGSHKIFPIKKRFVKIEGGEKGCDFIDVPNALKGSNQLSVDPSKREYRTVKCKAGDLVLIHNSVLHRSENNYSSKSRFAYAFHVIDGNCEYDKLNWLQVPPSKKGGTNFTKLFA